MLDGGDVGCACVVPLAGVPLCDVFAPLPLPPHPAARASTAVTASAANIFGKLISGPFARIRVRPMLRPRHSDLGKSENGLWSILTGGTDQHVRETSDFVREMTRLRRPGVGGESIGFVRPAPAFPAPILQPLVVDP